MTDGGTGAVDVTGALESLGLTSIKGNAPYVKSGWATTKAVFGSIVKTVSSMYVQALSGAEVRSLIGREPVWDGTDFAVVVNGAEEATTNQVHTVLNNQTNAVDLRVRSETGGDPTKGAMRFNYLIFAR